MPNASFYWDSISTGDVTGNVYFDLLRRSSEVEEKVAMKEVLVDLPKEVAEVHQMVKEGMSKPSGYNFTPSPVRGVVAELPKYKLETIDEVLGDFGMRLRVFVDNVDMDHPNVSGALANLSGSRLAIQMSDALRVSQYAKEIGADAILKLIKSTINDKKIVKELMANVLTAPPIRLLTRRADRDHARETGIYKMFDQGQQTVLGTAQKKKNPLAYSDVKLVVKGDSFWNEQPLTFKVHARCNTYNDAEMARMRGMQNYMASCSLTSMANSFGNRFSILQRLGSEQYCGFHRVGVTNAATILAKMHGFRVDMNYEKITLMPEHARRLSMALACVMVPNGHLLNLFRSFFSASCVRADDSYATDSLYEWLHKIAVDEHGKPAMLDADGIVMRYMKKVYGRFFFAYQPRMYPICSVKDLVPDFIWRTIDQLEDFAELQGRAVFDNYHVIVPGVDLDNNLFYNSTKQRYLFRNGGDLYDFDTKDKAYKFLDSHLIQNKMIYPIVVGQCDDKYYFINYLTKSES